MYISYPFFAELCEEINKSLDSVSNKGNMDAFLGVSNIKEKLFEICWDNYTKENDCDKDDMKKLYLSFGKYFEECFYYNNYSYLYHLCVGDLDLPEEVK